MKDLIILIPPSEGKKAGGEGAALKSVNPTVRRIVDKLSSEKENWEKVLGVKGRALEKAVAANRNILTSPTMPAVERYTGVVYGAVDYPSLDVKARIYFNEHVRIVSALFGLLKPEDFIPDYKLKIEKLGADKHWRPLITKILKDSFVIDLLPQAHKKAVCYSNGVSVDFLVLKNGKSVSAGHQGKHIKGRFIRWMCQKQCNRLEEFKNFTEDGFRWHQGCFMKDK